MIRIGLITQDGDFRTDLELNQITDFLAQEGDFIWLDISQEPPIPSKQILIEIFGFHPLATEAALIESHLSKVDDRGSYINFVLFEFENANPDSTKLDPRKLAVFVGKDFLVTYHDQVVNSVNTVWQSLEENGGKRLKNALRLLYYLSDELVNKFIITMDRYEEMLEEIEEQIFIAPRSEIIEQIVSLKRAAFELSRLLLHHREVFNKITHKESGLINEKDKLYFLDVYEHFVRMQDLNENFRELTTSALDIYLSVLNNRMNETFKVLTIITTLFMPISFLVGFFGMNFFRPILVFETWTGYGSFILVILTIIFIPGFMLLWFRKKAWI